MNPLGWSSPKTSSVLKKRGSLDSEMHPGGDLVKMEAKMGILYPKDEEC